jgi:hypothetical protein
MTCRPFRPHHLTLCSLLFAGCGSLMEKTPEEPPGNLLRNGSFEIWGEAGPAGWDLDQSGRSERLETDGGSFHGKIAAAVTCLHPDDFVVLEQTVPVRTPGLYRAQVYVQPVMPLRSSWMILEIVDAAGQKKEAARKEIRGQLAEWRPVAVTFVVPPGSTAVRYVLRFGPRATGGVSLDMARLELVQ